MADETSLMARLLDIQGKLKVEKGQWNSFSKFYYRSKENILEAAKPMCRERGLALMCDDEVVDVGGWHYVRCTASVVDTETGQSVSAHGLAREPEEKKGMDAAQITGTASSYAGKRALGNLFALDDTADSDATSEGATGADAIPDGPFVGHCRSCGAHYRFKGRDQYEAFMANGGCCPNPDWQVE